jgi:hypothetical protein
VKLPKGLKYPGAHPVQDAEPKPDVKVPAMQVAQRDTPEALAYDPGEQNLHSQEPAGLKDPGTQAVQVTGEFKLAKDP